MRRAWVGYRWLGTGLAALLAVATLTLWATGRLALYLNPSSDWLAVPMAVLLLVGAVLSFLLPLGAEADHGHDHGDQDAAHAHAHAHGHDHDHGHDAPRRARVLAVTGGVAASVVAAGVLLWPPASLSADIAQTRSTGSAPLFAGADVVQLASHGDTSTFGVGDWASVFATATNPDAFEGDAVTLIGFVTPGSGGTFGLTRLVITHCVIDAQTARVPVSATLPTRGLKTGQWVRVSGVVRTTAAGGLEVDARSVRTIAQPKDPYEY
ncbi:MAG TPA: TIGR03943 family protein [Microbacterium sp.]|uniref:TIGR03943 family putative permease subunit n=1 Tax=Microbacterium sp. TaxID=51671 RepID=UPI002B46E15C|nr:TIGR03943 family protein [Microbacterium sp.]HKT56096.1 TIGR03943 family protein [Microbacterium sp.]